jgi:tRNA(Arg) A34 adenosine deaminase TadA
MAPLYPLLASLLTLNTFTAAHHSSSPLKTPQQPVSSPELTVNGIPPSTRAHWMRAANNALAASGSFCPFAAFGTAIVNHTSSDTASLGDLICTGVNQNSATGNPTLHGEMVAITNCTAILTDPAGPYKLSAAEALAAWGDLTLYTNAESCPMCASAIRWAGFKEYVYGTSIGRLIETGWGQIDIASSEVFRQSWNLGTSTRFVKEVLTNETDPYFLWQFQEDYPCPGHCGRGATGRCEES